MLRFVLAVLALGLPAVSGAEEMWRWRDTTGGLHYSNVRSNVPSDAVPVRTQLGTLRGTPAPVPAGRTEKAAPASKTGEERPASMQNVGSCGSVYPYFCPGFSVPYILTIQGRDSADQVKQASLMDALHLRWQNYGCR
jgi:hypothetical protein